MGRTDVSTLVVNCRKLPFGSTLGVAHSVLQLASALSKHHDLYFVLVQAELDSLADNAAGETIRSIASRTLSIEQAQRERKALNDSAIELLPHQFQGPEFCRRSIAICYDLHVFDIPWKYGDSVEAMQRTFRHNMQAASAVITQFPRTYYAIETTADIHLSNLFLTEGPLLLDTTKALEEAGPQTEDSFLLYPAQLQAHKNHRALIDAVASLKATGDDVVITCPGSDFTPELSEEIRAYASSKRVADCFNFVGHISDNELVDLYRRCQGVIVPSVAEGGAAVVLEAVAAGKPVAANSIDAARRHAAAMEAHVDWFDAASVADTARAIIALSTADHLAWLRRNEACRNRLSKQDWGTVADKWNRVISMLEGSAERPQLHIDRTASEISYA